MSNYEYAKVEGVMVVLQQLSEKDGFTVYPTKKYVVDKLTELKLAEYVEPIINNYYKMTKDELKKKIALLIANELITNNPYKGDESYVVGKLPLASEILDLVQDYLDINDLLVK